MNDHNKERVVAKGVVAKEDECDQESCLITVVLASFEEDVFCFTY